MQHIPVLLDDVLGAARGMTSAPRKFLDLTFGRGGHARALLEEFPEGQMHAVDQDQAAIDFAKENFSEWISSGRIQLHHQNFAQASELNEKDFDFILVDLGVSSPQLDDPERGFSFYHDGPLDMRMDQRGSESAATIINNWEEDDLYELFTDYGEVRNPRRVIKAILQDRESKEFKSTLDLSHLIERVEGWRKKGQHPATKYFLALRLMVNRELEVTRDSILPLIEMLADGGRLLVITFHSLEDRIVKNEFKKAKEEELGFWVNKKVIQAQWPEKQKNPRARSAKLRIFEREIGEENQ